MATYNPRNIQLLSESELASCAEQLVISGMKDPSICAGTEEDALYYGMCLEKMGFFVDIDVLPPDHPLSAKSGLHSCLSLSSLPSLSFQ
ncbi:MAG: hypothetical protein M1165_02755 [Candidatus Pacearchaeota archaeon]|nr:hypothetical protein [Candidatus Pacearchaeota archaeon]